MSTTNEQALTRAVERVYPSREEVQTCVDAGKKLRIYLGIDPTGPTLHIGHAATLLKLRDLQDCGHQVILLIGDFTAMIGDPTDKGAARKKLTAEEVQENLRLYREQAGKILDMDKTEIRFNSEWHSTLTFADVLDLASEFTVQQMLERDMFANRVKEEKPIYIHEFMYPLMQGYDSVMLDVDMEIGGNDQTFNMLAGRTMMKTRGKEKFVLTTKILVDPTGKKMGKSEGNMVAFTDTPEDVYGKVMSWPDSLMPLGFEICTRLPTEEIHDILAGDPRDAKMRLAREITKLVHNESLADSAQDQFIAIHQNKEIPDTVADIIVDESISVVGALVRAGFSASKSDARRAIEQGGVKVNGEVVSDEDMLLTPTHEGILIQKGKRFFARVKSA